MADDDAARAAWVLRVLGVDVAGRGAAASAPRDGVLAIWAAARDEVDDGINKLTRALRETGDVDLVRIAEYGLNGATDQQGVALMVALREADAAGTPQARDRLLAATGAFRTFLKGSRLVALLEDNPFGVPLPLRSRLGAALDRIEASV